MFSVLVLSILITVLWLVVLSNDEFWLSVEPSDYYAYHPPHLSSSSADLRDTLMTGELRDNTDEDSELPSPSSSALRIAMVTLSTHRQPGSDGYRIGQISFMEKYLYASTQGYSFFWHTQTYDRWGHWLWGWPLQRSIVWSKLSLLLYHMHQTIELPFTASTATTKRRKRRYAFDWVLWLDSDTIIYHRSKKIEELIDLAHRSVSLFNERSALSFPFPLRGDLPPPSNSDTAEEEVGDGSTDDTASFILPTLYPQIISTNDGPARPLNAGVLLIRNTRWTRRLFRYLLTDPLQIVRFGLLDWAAEQSALTSYLVNHRSDVTGQWVVLPRWLLNSMVFDFKDERTGSAYGSYATDVSEDQTVHNATTRAAVIDSHAASTAHHRRRPPLPPLTVRQSPHSRISWIFHTAGCETERLSSFGSGVGLTCWDVYNRRAVTKLRYALQMTIDQLRDSVIEDHVYRSGGSDGAAGGAANITMATIFPQLFSP